MASTYITYSAAKPGGQAVYRVVDGVLTAWYAVQRIKAEMDSLIGSPPDYTQLEAKFGLATAGGQAFYTAVVNLKSNLDTTSASLKDMDQTA